MTMQQGHPENSAALSRRALLKAGLTAGMTLSVYPNSNMHTGIW